MYWIFSATFPAHNSVTFLVFVVRFVRAGIPAATADDVRRPRCAPACRAAHDHLVFLAGGRAVDRDRVVVPCVARRARLLLLLLPVVVVVSCALFARRAPPRHLIDLVDVLVMSAAGGGDGRIPGGGGFCPACRFLLLIVGGGVLVVCAPKRISPRAAPADGPALPCRVRWW